MAPIGTAKYGMAATPIPQAVADGASNGAVAPADDGGFIGSPVFWLLGIAAAAMGLAGVSTSARLGPFRASVSAGSS